MLIGYIRVSSETDRQNTNLQKDALIKCGIDERNIYEDNMSGIRDDRPRLKSGQRSWSDEGANEPGRQLAAWRVGSWPRCKLRYRDGENISTFITIGRVVQLTGIEPVT